MGNLEQPDTERIEMEAVLRALADETRMTIVRTLASEGELACQSVDLEVSKATRSHHFKILREAGVTNTRLEGTSRLVSLRRTDLDARFPGLLDAVLQTSATAA